MVGIYEIVHITSGRSYVGQSIDVERRFKQHYALLANGKSRCQNLQRAWTKYGASAFVFRPILTCAVDELDRAEQYIIDERGIRNLYNTCPAVGSSRGVVASAATRLRQSLAHTGKKLSPETRKKMSDIRKGRSKSSEHCRKIGAALRGKSKPLLSQERRWEIRKTAAAALGKPVIDERGNTYLSVGHAADSVGINRAWVRVAIRKGYRVKGIRYWYVDTIEERCHA
jgi:group I intron endonuclease